MKYFNQYTAKTAYRLAVSMFPFYKINVKAPPVPRSWLTQIMHALQDRDSLAYIGILPREVILRNGMNNFLSRNYIYKILASEKTSIHKII